jgi:Putative adhesin
MTTRPVVAGVFLLAALSIAAPASAQRFAFERTYDVGSTPVIDVSTTRGKINVRAGEPGRVVVTGAATVRIGVTVPVNAVELARKVAEQPPIEQSADRLRLRSPASPEENRAMTVNYDLRVPPNARVIAVSDSGAIDVRDVAGGVEARTQSSSIGLSDLGGTADVDTGSGAVTVDRVAGIVRVSTSSSAITARNLRGGLRAKTGSGRVVGSFVGEGPIDVQTQSSAIDLSGVSGALTTFSESGHTYITGEPSAAWNVTSGSSGIDVHFASKVHATLHATTSSGTVYTPERLVAGSIEKGRVEGAIGNGGPVVRLSSRSGSIRVR